MNYSNSPKSPWPKVITLKTLPDATAQEVFDYIANHLLTQNRRSLLRPYDFPGKCMYRNSEGLKCAAGSLISDDEYKAMMEFKNWNTLVDLELVSGVYEDLILSLQWIHDSIDPVQWKNSLIELAKNNNLTWNFS